MADGNYTPPKVWTWDKENGGEWAKTNRPNRRTSKRKGPATGQAPIAALFAGNAQWSEGHDLVGRAVGSGCHGG